MPCLNQITAKYCTWRTIYEIALNPKLERRKFEGLEQILSEFCVVSQIKK